MLSLQILDDISIPLTIWEMTASYVVFRYHQLYPDTVNNKYKRRQATLYSGILHYMSIALRIRRNQDKPRGHQVYSITLQYVPQ